MSARSAVSHVAAEDGVEVCTAVNARLSTLPLHELHAYCSVGAADSSSPTTVTWVSSPSPQPPAVTLEMLCTDRLADTLACIVTDICARSQYCSLPQSTHPLAFFYCPTKQTFSLSFYCRRLLQYNRCSKPCVALALVYLFRVQSNEYLQVNDYNVHRLLCTALMLATKWHDDVSYDNSHYAAVGGIASTKEMNVLELHMLRVLDHALFVNSHTYSQIEMYLLQWAFCQ
ncbi:Cyclin-U4-1 [Gracilariopsis chorda]|uniref:Cyclin-U4-1 n=1 Tax=Gracilariopsis chorda TaxID=448386 RepID=A0A2V3IFB8_9FLOR|nr:Cyclin-U4-1 [Gracilariopsis chorda]|eukprot:PXF40786.1 Cyclin-U4-1 [Gracilariopsis chorda]